MKVRVKSTKRDDIVVEVPNDGTVNDLREGIAKQYGVESAHVKIVCSGKMLSKNDDLLAAAGIKDINVVPDSCCVALVSSKVAPAPGSTPIGAPAPALTPTPVATPTPVVTPAPAPFDFDPTMEGVGAFDPEAFGLPPGMDITAAMQDPKLVDTIAQFRVNNPIYASAYQLFPDQTKELLANPAFIFVSLQEFVKELMDNQEGGHHNHSGQIKIKFLETEGPEVQDMFKMFVEMGYDPLDVIQMMRAVDYDWDATLDLLSQNVAKDRDDDDE